MKEVLYTVLEMNVYAVIIWAAITVFRKIAGTRLSATLRLALWGLLIARLACPVTFDMGVRLLPQLQPAALRAGAQHAESADVPEAGSSGTALSKADADAVRALRVQAAADNTGEKHQPEDASVINMDKLLTFMGSIWIGGMTAMAVSLAMAYARLRSRIRRDCRGADEQLETVFLACCRQLGIQRHLHLIVTDAVHGPALLVPNIVLYPPDTSAMSYNEMRMSMMHELTHYIRRDWVLLMVCVALRIAYWFNPVVWLAARQIRSDIEDACDSDVVQELSTSNKADYARTILLLYGLERCSEGLMPFAANRCEKQVKERIKRIFLSTKSGKTTRFAACVVAGVLALTCFTTACQRVPAHNDSISNVPAPAETRVSASGAQFEKPAPSISAAPSGIIPVLIQTGNWQAQMEMPDGKVDIDASVYLPNTQTLPIYSIEHEPGSPELARKVTQALWGDDMPAFRPAPAVTAEERDRIVAEYTNLIRKYEEEGPDPDETLTVEERIAEFEDAIQHAEDAYKESMDRIGHETADFAAFTWQPDLEEYGLKYDVLFADGTTGRLAAWPRKNDEQIGASVYYESESWKNDTCAGFTGSLENAVRDASAKVNRLGGTWTLADAKMDEQMGCACISFRPAVGNVPMIDARLSSATGASVLSSELSEAMERGQYELAPRLWGESLTMYYDDTGLICFEWHDIWNVTGTVEEAPVLLSVEDAQNIFIASFVDNNGDSIPANEINVDRIELGYAYSFAKDAPGEYRLIPVYDITGSTTFYDHENGYPISFMTINALDGSIYRREISM